MERESRLLAFLRVVSGGPTRSGDAKAPAKPPTRWRISTSRTVFSRLTGTQGVRQEFEFSSSLMPLKPLKDDILVLSQLWNSAADTGDGHYVKSAGWLTGTTIHKTSGSDIRSNGISVDQLAAQQLGNLTRLPSLELGTEPTLTAVDLAVGYTRLYGAHISWRSPIMPIAKEINPQVRSTVCFKPIRHVPKVISRTIRAFSIWCVKTPTRFGAKSEPTINANSMNTWIRSARSKSESR